MAARRNPIHFFPVSNNNDPVSSVREVIKELWPKNAQAKTHNILIFGKIGAGKTSFINSIIKAFGGKSFGGVAQAGQAEFGSSFTLHYQKFQIPDTNIVLWDTFGWETTKGSPNYSPSEFQNYLLGLVPPGQARNSEHQVDPNHAASTRKDAVIFLIPSALALPSKAENLLEHWNNFLPYYMKCKQHKIPVVFALSQLDLLPNFTNLRTSRKIDTKQIEINSEYGDLRTSLLSVISPYVPSKATNIRPSIAYQAVEYSNTSSNDPLVDEYALGVLLATYVDNTIKPPSFPPETVVEIERIRV